jgi:tRNA(Ile)-lysidine synthase
VREKVLRYIRERRLLRAGDRVCVAVSGGADSVALLRILLELRTELGIVLFVGHFNHGLRAEESEADEAFVADLARQHGLEFFVGRNDVRGYAASRKLSIEAAGRKLRYEWFTRLADEQRFDAVATAHTLDDQAETVLLGLARGSGARSLAGMPPRRGVFLRPLLGLRRRVTVDACAALGLAPWADPHNADRRFARVRVRLDALPALEAALGPGVAEALARTADQLRDDAEVLDKIASSERSADPAPMSAASLAGLPDAVRSRVLRSAALAAGCPATALTSAHVTRIGELVTDWRGQRWIDLPGGVRATRRSGQVLFELAK